MYEKPVWYRALAASAVMLLGANSLVLANRLSAEVTARDTPGIEAVSNNPILVAQTVGTIAGEKCLLLIGDTHLGCAEPSTSTTTTLAKKPLPAVPPAVSSLSQPTTLENELQTGLTKATPAEIAYLGCISVKESTNNPGEYNAAGPYYGKYQFLQKTWNNFVVFISHPELVDVDIRQVPEATQDYIAWRFLQAKRNKEWGPNHTCAHYLS